MYAITSASKRSTTASRQFSKTTNGVAWQRKQNGQAVDALSHLITTGQRSRLQAKLTIGKSGDRYEQEADQVAQTVTTSPTPAASRASETQEKKEPVQTNLRISSLPRQTEEKKEDAQKKPPIRQQEQKQEKTQTSLNERQEEEKEEAQTKLQRQEEEKEEAQTKLQRQEEEKEETLQEKPAEQKNPRATLRDKKEFPVLNSIEEKIHRRKGKGEELDAETKTAMAVRFGADFSDVRIHKDQEASEISRELKAQAFTYGADVYFAAGKYEPDSLRGRVLLAHELTHVVQQGATEQQIPGSRIDEHNAQKDLREPEPPDKEVQDVMTNNEEQEASFIKEKVGVTEENERNTKKFEAWTEAQGGEKQIELEPDNTTEGTVEAFPEEKPSKEQEGKKATAVGEYLRAQAEPALKKSAKNIKSLAVNESAADDAATKLAQTEKAVVPPAQEGQAQANATQVDTVDKAPEPTPDETTAQKKFHQTLQNAIPKTLEEVDKFKEKGKGRVVGEAVKGVVAIDTSAVQTTYQKIENTPPPPPSKHRPEELQAIEKAPATPELQLGEGVVADLKTEHTDLSQFDQESDTLLNKEGITEEQLEMVDDGELLEAKNERKDMKKKVKEAPAEINALKDKEKQQVGQELKQEETQAKHAMRGERKKRLTGAKDDQKETKSQLELKRQKVTEQINAMYEKAHTTVKQKLEKLEKDALKAFDDGEKHASRTFEDNVERRMNAFKRKRYDRAGGSVLKAADWLLGMDDLPEVKAIFESEKATFVNTVNNLVKTITTENKKVIRECKNIIAETRKAIETYVKSLGPELRKTGQDALKSMKTKLDALDRQVNEKEKELKKKLEAKKEAAIKAIEEKIEKMKEEMSGALAKLGNFLLDAMLKFFRWALKKAGYNEKQLLDIINKGKAVIKKIVGDPIGFIKNLINAVKNGIGNFQKNIKKHLVSGLVNWLTGAMGDIQIQLPSKFDVKGILFLVLQILGLTWNTIRPKFVKRLGEKAVSVAEKSVDILKRIVKEGPIALWNMLKEKAAAIKQQVMEGIRNWIITELVKQGIIKLLSFLNPAGAIVQAILAIYNTIMFFVENWQRIVEFVKTVFNSIADIAMGKLSAAAKAVERALAMTIPIILNFLSRLLNLSGIGKAVQKIIQKIRKPIDKVVDKAINFIAKKAKGLVKRGKTAAARIVNWWRARKQFKDRAGKSHVLSFKGRGRSARLLIASTPQTIEVYLNSLTIEQSDSRFSQLTRARQLASEIKVITRSKVEPREAKQIVQKMTELSKLLIVLGGATMRDIPRSAQWNFSSGTQQKVTSVEKLSTLTSKGGSTPSGSNAAFDYLRSNNMTNKGDKWVRMHLISERVGGPGDSRNWVPAPNSVNTGAEVTSFESAVKGLVEKSNKKNKPSNKKNKPNVAWIKATARLRSPNPSYGNVEGFPQTVSFQAGMYFLGERDWQKDSSPKISENVPVPEPTGGEVPSLSRPSRTALSAIKHPEVDTGAVFSSITVKRIRSESANGAKPFLSEDSLIARLQAFDPNTRWQNKITNQIKPAIKKLLEAKKITIQ